MSRPKTLIKKYNDRRLYDSTARRYVNLGEIARMVREGVEVEVVDAGTGKDLTRMILTQIIMEDIRDGEAGLPLQLLRQLVVASDRATHDFLAWYLETAGELYQKTRTAVTNPVDFVKHLVGRDDRAEVEELRRKVQELEARLARRKKGASSG